MNQDHTDEPINWSQLPRRIQGALREEGIETYGQLCSMTEAYERADAMLKASGR